MNVQQIFERLGGVRPIFGNELCPMNESGIIAIERQIGNRLPDCYRKFLSTYGACTFNGQSPDNPYIVYRSLTHLPSHISNDGRGMVDALYGSEMDESDPYGLRVRILFFAGRMPDSLIPIGDDGGAGQICLGIKGNEMGAVFYWDQANEPLDEDDYEEDFGVPRPPEIMFQNVYQIAESFDDFLGRLEIMEA
ncbi:SMI1/KNR4 family protein [Blastopirellula marina]|nr:SMI1/KNR4 family protein [Blastopirellula marina]